MLTVRQLRELLAQVPPDLEVTTWDPELKEPVAVEQVIQSGEAVVLGMEMSAGWTVDGAKIIWCAHDIARRGLEKVQALWERAKGEWVG